MPDVIVALVGFNDTATRGELVIAVEMWMRLGPRVVFVRPWDGTNYNEEVMYALGVPLACTYVCFVTIRSILRYLWRMLLLWNWSGPRAAGLAIRYCLGFLVCLTCLCRSRPSGHACWY